MLILGIGTYLQKESSAEYDFSRHRLRDGQAVHVQNGRSDVDQRRVWSTDRSVGPEHAWYFEGVGTMVGAPGGVVVRQDLLRQLSLDGVPGSRVAAMVADDQVGGQCRGISGVDLIGTVGGADHWFAVEVLDIFQPVFQFDEQLFG